MVPQKTVNHDGQSTPVYVLRQYPDGGEITMAVTRFEAQFGQGPYTHAGLSAAKTMPGLKTWWQDLFDEWKANGHIS